MVLLFTFLLYLVFSKFVHEYDVKETLTSALPSGNLINIPLEPCYYDSVNKFPEDYAATQFPKKQVRTGVYEVCPRHSMFIFDLFLTTPTVGNKIDQPPDWTILFCLYLKNQNSYTSFHYVIAHHV